MKDKITQFIAWFKGLDLPWMITVFVVLVLSAAVLLFGSCSRSALHFKGQGDLEYEYVGKYGTPLNPKHE